MGKAQRRFGKEFEAEAVRLVEASGRTQREIAEDLGIGLSTLPAHGVDTLSDLLKDFAFFSFIADQQLGRDFGPLQALRVDVTNKLEDRFRLTGGWWQSRLQAAMAVSSNPLSSTRKSARAGTVSLILKSHDVVGR